FNYHDKRRRADIYFPRGGDAAHVEATRAAGRSGIVRDGGTYGCVFTGGAANNLLTFTMFKRPTGAGLLRAFSKAGGLVWVVLKGSVVSMIELSRALLRVVADPLPASTSGWKWPAVQIALPARLPPPLPPPHPPAPSTPPPPPPP